MLRAPADHATRHEQRVYLGDVACHAAQECYADEAAVTEDVREGEVDNHPVRVAHEGDDLRLGVPMRREVELVRLLRELRDPRNVTLIVETYPHHHFQRRPIVLPLTERRSSRLAG